MLRFYSVVDVYCAKRIVTNMVDKSSRIASALCVLVLAGCVSQPLAPPEPPIAAPVPQSAEPPPPPVNLSGFPLLYRQGFADGCASASGAARKDAVRFPADANYRTGWQDGLAQCRRKK